MSAPLSMGQFIKDLERMGQLRRIKDEVDPLSGSHGPDRPGDEAHWPGPACSRTSRARKCPIAINLYGSRQRMAHALGVKRIEDVGERIRAMMEMEIPDGLWAKVKSAIPKLKQLAAFKAKEVKNARLPTGRFGGRGRQPGHPAHPHLLARGRRPVHHPAPGHHRRPGDRPPEHRHVPHAKNTTPTPRACIGIGTRAARGITKRPSAWAKSSRWPWPSAGRR